MIHQTTDKSFGFVGGDELVHVVVAVERVAVDDYRCHETHRRDGIKVHTSRLVENANPLLAVSNETGTDVQRDPALVCKLRRYKHVSGAIALGSVDSQSF